MTLPSGVIVHLSFSWSATSCAADASTVLYSVEDTPGSRSPCPTPLSPSLPPHTLTTSTPHTLTTHSKWSSSKQQSSSATPSSLGSVISQLRAFKYPGKPRPLSPVSCPLKNDPPSDLRPLAISETASCVLDDSVEITQVETADSAAANPILVESSPPPSSPSFPPPSSPSLPPPSTLSPLLFNSRETTPTPAPDTTHHYALDTTPLNTPHHPPSTRVTPPLNTPHHPPSTRVTPPLNTPHHPPSTRVTPPLHHPPCSSNTSRHVAQPITPDGSQPASTGDRVKTECRSGDETPPLSFKTNQCVDEGDEVRVMGVSCRERKSATPLRRKKANTRMTTNRSGCGQNNISSLSTTAKVCV